MKNAWLKVNLKSAVENTFLPLCEKQNSGRNRSKLDPHYHFLHKADLKAVGQVREGSKEKLEVEILSPTTSFLILLVTPTGN